MVGYLFESTLNKPIFPTEPQAVEPLPPTDAEVRQAMIHDLKIQRELAGNNPLVSVIFWREMRILNKMKGLDALFAPRVEGVIRAVKPINAVDNKGRQVYRVTFKPDNTKNLQMYVEIALDGNAFLFLEKARKARLLLIRQQRHNFVQVIINGKEYDLPNFE